MDDETQMTLTGTPVTKLVNQHRTDGFDVDIGRANGGESHLLNTEPRNPGWLGNPWSVDDVGDREEAIRRYREAFYEQLEDDAFRNAVENLRGKTLACWCKPKPCHGDVIVEFLRDEAVQSEK